MTANYDNLYQVANNLSTTFPDLENINPLSVLGEGLPDLVVETNRGIVFRIGKKSGSIARYRSLGIKLASDSNTLSWLAGIIITGNNTEWNLRMLLLLISSQGQLK